MCKLDLEEGRLLSCSTEQKIREVARFRWSGFVGWLAPQIFQKNVCINTCGTAASDKYTPDNVLGL